MVDPHHKQEERFDALIGRADRKELSFSELRELSRLYRVCSSRLSIEREREPDPERLGYLNSLCVRAYAHVYVSPPKNRRQRWLWLSEVPAALGRSLRRQLLAAGLLALGAVLGAVLVLEDNSALGAIVPTGMYGEATLRKLYDSPEARAAFLTRAEVPGQANTQFASYLFANNTRVGLLAAASGIAGSVPTLGVLVHNGLTLGGFATIFLRGPDALLFTAWILPHAITELLAIVLCAAAGLGLGFAVLAPGRAGRARALRSAASDALYLVVASLPLFLAAALIESFVRQSAASTSFRFAVAGLSVASLAGYVSLVRWLARRQPAVKLGFLAASEAQSRPAPRTAQ